jgi:hypothetical protein
MKVTQKFQAMPTKQIFLVFMHDLAGDVACRHGCLMNSLLRCDEIRELNKQNKAYLFLHLQKKKANI